ncbi:hypothetical protein C7974DRAFT_422931 [Boeremia exigua]|uniref:uncharacterized protein n=1 Tax=Boeremia exigua TaxID=749465 RepID=UPI001E8D7E13|nr:uncharacterized protein C7974DRAFT_422931 [Boeremia exigua]KAH6637989.1 hypothetical protein C7974DRAFT_422931 [Boeremia exigua]
MYQRNVSPTVGVLRRTLAADAAATRQSPSRPFSVSARRLEESSDAPSAPAAASPPNRRARNAAALSQITRLGANRRSAPGGLAKGIFPSGQTDGQPGGQPGGQLARGPPRARPEGSLNITREPSGPDGPRSAPPPGAMARAPARLKLSSAPRTGNASVGGRRGPNLRGRDAKPAGNSDKGGPRKRERTDKADEEVLEPGGSSAADVLSDGMVRHLLRMQRSEWDRKAYVPKYAPGSLAANRLIHAGRELMRGESAPIKIWGALERRIGVVGMHGAEAHLKIRRVPMENDDRLGERRRYFETGNVDIEVKALPSKAAPAADVQAAAQAAASAPAPEQPVAQ